MMRRLLGILLFLSAFAASAQLQRFGNEWINYEARYWAFTVTFEGLHRLDSADLANAGFPLSTVDARTIQVFGREKEVPIYFPGDSDGVMNAADVIEFYAMNNDAWMDSLLWDSPEHINNPNYSQISDTLEYFITWGATPSPQRVIARSAAGYSGTANLRPWFWAEAFTQQVNTYKRGTRDGIGASTSFLGEAEGYMGSDWIQDGNDPVIDLQLPTVNPYGFPPAPPARFEFVVGSTNAPGNLMMPDHHLVVKTGASLTTVADTIWTGYRLMKLRKELPPNELGQSTLARFEQVHDLYVPNTSLTTDYPDRQALSYARVVYPHSFLFAGETARRHMWIPNDETNSPAHIAIGQYFDSPILYVFGDTLRRIIPILQNNGPNALIPADATSDSTHVIMFPASQVINITAPLRPVNGSGFFNDYTANPLDSAVLVVTHPSLWTGANYYADYRSSNPYNQRNTLVVDVNDLYRQYSGGVPRHPVAIRRFVAHVLDEWESKPEALFLIGKSVQAPKLGGGDNAGYRSYAAGDSAARRLCLVPSFGFPPSDHLLTLGLSGNAWDLTVPVGRLAAHDNNDVINYTNKLQQLESQPPAAWMKNILHFRGGLSQGDVQEFDYHLEQYRSIIEDTCFSGNVTKFSRILDDGEIIQFAAADSVLDMVAEGVTLMTFLAHAYGGGFDFSIDQPANYVWNQKYPMIIGNSCYTGNINQVSSTSGSEQFVLPANSGAIAFLASIDLAVTWALIPATKAFYTSFSQANYGRSIGRHIQYMDSTILVNANGTIMGEAGIQQFTLHGDPSLILNSPKEPDFEITTQDIRFRPEPVTADVDTFQVVATVRNIGKGTGAAFPVAVRRELLEENITIETAALQSHVMQEWQDTLVFSLPVLQDSGGAGNNLFTVRVDLDPEQVDESDDFGNNEATAALLITSGELLPVDPYNFAITPDPAPMLQASTGDPFAPVRSYVFQIDTTDTYDSPRMEQGTVNAPGGVVSWMPPTIYTLNASQDSLVYFWRCSIDSVGNGGYEWREFSFQYVPGRTGWGQAHHMQFKDGFYNNSFSTLIHDRPGRDFDFLTGSRSISCETRNNSTTVPKWKKDLSTVEGLGCTAQAALHLAVVDPVDLEEWRTWWDSTGHFLNAQNDQPNPCAFSYRSQGNFQFRLNTVANEGAVQLPALANALEDSIPDGHYILLFTYRSLYRDVIDAVAPQLIDVLEDLGAANLADGTVPDSSAYIFFCQKGNNTFTQEHWSTRTDSTISMSAFVPVSGRAGRMSAPVTGEVLTWNSLHWEIDPTVPTDSATILVNTLNVDAVEQLAHTEIPAATVDSLLLPDVGVDPLLHPRLHLVGTYRSEQGIAPRPAQTKRWQIVATPAPECAIDPPLGFFKDLDSLFEGENARVMVAVNNISAVPMDSLLMAAWVIDENNVRHLVHYARRAPLAVGGVVLDTIAFSVAGFAGLNTLIIEANPLDTATGYYDQREQFHFNNIAILRFETMRDMLNPVLDVTFDGIHILDGDIVSARPEIEMSLDDENLALIMDALEDTVNIKVFLRRPDSNTEEQLRFSGADAVLEFIPATAPDNICRIKYNPVLAQDGVYSLRVRASDVSRNASGSEDYTVRFEVINKPTITEVLNYPNPFTTSTRFVFTLTGYETPTAMRIRIMTIGGRVVREIGLDEIGPLHIGRNVSEYAWDGMDEFGDKLARGVYLYQVVAQLHGEDIEYRETKAGGYFTKGFGKMYLLR